MALFSRHPLNEFTLKMLGTVADRITVAVERHKAADALLKLSKHHQLILGSAGEGIYGLDLEGKITFVNPAAARLVGYEVEELIGKPQHAMLHHSKPDGSPYPQEECTIYSVFKDGVPHSVNSEVFWRKDGTSFPVEYTSTPIRDEQETIRGAVVTFRDITERKQLEVQTHKAQRMDAVGRLAGGVAHDFNNILTIINGHSELLSETGALGDDQYQSIEMIRQACKRVSFLTTQLLAFSGRQILQPKLLNFNALVADIEQNIHALVGDDIKLMIMLTQSKAYVQADANQLEQVIFNLVDNARSAMPHGGMLTIATDTVEMDEVQIESYPTKVSSGPHVILRVSDNGIGMDEKTLSHCFEPFFSTNPKSQGTGLGLSTVYGIVEKSGGVTIIKSELGTGTSVTIYLPRLEGDIVLEDVGPSLTTVPHGSETILVAEDELGIRTLIGQTLRKSGYSVLEARDGVEALAIENEHAGPIHLFLTDVIMPKLNGRETADKLASKRPQAKVLYMSGYTDDALLHREHSSSYIHLIQKPFTAKALAQKVRNLLDGDLKK